MNSSSRYVPPALALSLIETIHGGRRAGNGRARIHGSRGEAYRLHARLFRQRRRLAEQRAKEERNLLEEEKT